jgi:hypothetical protein
MSALCGGLTVNGVVGIAEASVGANVRALCRTITESTEDTCLLPVLVSLIQEYAHLRLRALIDGLESEWPVMTTHTARGVAAKLMTDCLDLPASATNLMWDPTQWMPAPPPTPFRGVHFDFIVGSSHIHSENPFTDVGDFILATHKPADNQPPLAGDLGLLSNNDSAAIGKDAQSIASELVLDARPPNAPKGNNDSAAAIVSVAGNLPFASPDACLAKAPRLDAAFLPITALSSLGRYSDPLRDYFNQFLVRMSWHVDLVWVSIAGGAAFGMFPFLSTPSLILGTFDPLFEQLGPGSHMVIDIDWPMSMLPPHPHSQPVHENALGADNAALGEHGSLGVPATTELETRGTANSAIPILVRRDPISDRTLIIRFVR